MQTFDQALYDLYAEGSIGYEDALAHADSSNNLRLMIKLGADHDADSMNETASGLQMAEDHEEGFIKR